MDRYTALAMPGSRVSPGQSPAEQQTFRMIDTMWDHINKNYPQPSSQLAAYSKSHRCCTHVYSPACPATAPNTDKPFLSFPFLCVSVAPLLLRSLVAHHHQLGQAGRQEGRGGTVGCHLQAQGAGAAAKHQ